MSKPGYPISGDLTISVSNSYHRATPPADFNGTDSCLIKSRFEDKSGDNTPGWPHAIRTNGYLRSVFLFNQSPLFVNGTVSPSGDTFTGSWGNTFGLGYSPWTDSYWSTNLERTICYDYLIGKIIDQIQSNRVNLGELLETRAQTANLVASTCRRLAQTLWSLKKGNMGGALQQLFGTASAVSKVKRLGGGIPDQWLQLQYGWKPLLQDVYNSCETVRKAWSDNGDMFTVRASKHLNGELKTRHYGPSPAHGPVIEYKVTSNETHGSASVTYGVGNQFTQSLSQLGITNPASLAWELLPYSFVVDWFIPIGSFLERLDYSRGLLFKHGYVTIVSRTELSSRLSQTHTVSGGITSNWSGGSGSGSAMVMQRFALSSFPSPPTPRFKDPFSLTHVANALSLLATAFGR